MDLVGYGVGLGSIQFMNGCCIFLGLYRERIPRRGFPEYLGAWAVNHLSDGKSKYLVYILEHGHTLLESIS